MSDRRPQCAASSALLFVLAAAAAAADPDADPTRPPAMPIEASRSEASAAEAPLALQAVFYAEGRRVAIIDGQRVRQGEQVRSARVVRIERDRVALRRNGETIELVLVDTDVKRPSPATERTGDLRSSPALPDLPASIAAPQEGSHR